MKIGSERTLKRGKSSKAKERPSEGKPNFKFGRKS